MLFRAVGCLIIGAAGFSSALASDNKYEWNYSKNGPEKWGTHYSTCAQGKEQSPINVDKLNFSVSGDIEPVYQDGFYTPHYSCHDKDCSGPSAIKYSIDPLNKKNFIIIDGQKYSLVQFHIHTPSEHTYDGKKFPMEIHFVHKDGNGNLAVLGVLVEVGEKNTYIAQLLNNSPAKGEESSDNFVIDPREILGSAIESDSFLVYNGSLTTPPCTEGVKWVLVPNRITIDEETLNKFSDMTGITDNARPVQELNNRTIELQN